MAGSAHGLASICTVECDAMYAPGGTIGPCPHPLKKADDDPEPF